MAHQTSDYAGWLLRLTVEYWITIKAKPGKRGTCCSLWLSERWRVREVSGWSIATSSASAHSIEPLEMASSICNFKAPGSVLERCGHVYVCVYLACVRVRACVSHYSFVSPEWVVAIQALCVQSERRREAHLDMRSQIIHLTLRQEGSTERRRAKLKESEEKKGKKRGNQRGRWWEKNKQQSEWCKLQRGKRKRLALKGNSDEKECVCESERARWSEKENEGETAAECYCAFLIRPAERFYCPQLYNEQLRV